MKKAVIALMAMAFSVPASAQHQQEKAWQRPAPEVRADKNDSEKRDRIPSRTLDKAPPAPRPGEGFLIRGREGSAMDAGRPKQGAPADWDLWRK